VLGGRAVADGWRLVGKSVARDVVRVDDDDILIDEGGSVHTAVSGHNSVS
jgi:hypothetical protein